MRKYAVFYYIGMKRYCHTVETDTPDEARELIREQGGATASVYNVLDVTDNMEIPPYLNVINTHNIIHVDFKTKKIIKKGA